MGSRIHIILFLLVLCSPFYVFSQNGFAKEVIEPLSKDALYREKVFIHLNKSVYFTNENIWFKAYVAKEDNKPSGFTTNLLVNLFDIKGDVVESKDVFVNKGTAQGDFFIDNQLKSGTYFIQGFTNFMQNFGPQNVFLQKIEIINPSDKGEFSPSETTADQVVKFFPESGHLLEGVRNTIGVKVTAKLRGNTFHGKIVDSKGVDVTTFKGNRFGMGKCSFFYKENESYIAIITTNDSVQRYNLPKAKKTGLVFSIDNTDVEKIALTLSTNQETLPSLKSEKLALLFYRNNTLYEAASLSLENAQKMTQELFFDKSKMLPGVNSVALFKNNQPIAERKFFVDKPDEDTAVMIEQVEIANDSILFKIITLGPDYKPVASQLSISILPEETRAFTENQNIKSGFLLSPNIREYIENPAFYFRNMDENEKEYLDVLLINQETANHTLEGMILKINPKEKFDFKNGFTFRGTIKRPPRGFDLGLLSNDNMLITYSKISEKKEFSFENVFAYKNNNLKIALIKKNQPFVKPESIKFKIPEVTKKNYGYLTYAFGQEQDGKNDSRSTTEIKEYSSMKAYPHTEILDEVVVQGVKPQQKVKTIYDVEMAMANKHKVVASWAYKGTKVTKQLETINETVFDYLRNLGHIKPSPSNKVASYFITLRSTPATIIDLAGNANPDGSFPPRIYIDNGLINQNDNIETLRELSMKYVDEILINKSGASGGVNGTGGMIRIYLKKFDHQYFDAGPKDLYETVLTPEGFDRPKAYARPQYSIKSKEAFNWTEIDWRPSVETNEKGEGFVKVPKNDFSNKFQFIINGFSESGLLFHNIFTTNEDGF